MIFAGLNCQCGEGAHYQGARYYVTVRRDDGAHRFLVGPFVEHGEALALVDRARRVAESIDPKAVWYAFGTAVCWINAAPGMLNPQALDGCRECFRVPGTTDSQGRKDDHWRGCSPANAPRKRRRRAA